MRPTSRLARAALALCTAAGLVACGSDTTPNLLLVVFDTTRADHLTPYGSRRDTSPEVARLAERGLLCTSAWSQSSLTPVSAGSFLTGTLPHEHGVRSLFATRFSMMSEDVRTLPEILQEAGWATASFVSAPPMDARYGFHRGFDHWDHDTTLGAQERKARGMGNAFQRRGDRTTDRALEWLRANEGEPFALLLHMFDAHDATLVPPREFLQRHVSFPLPGNLDEQGHLLGVKARARRIELYDAEIRFMDDQFGRVLAQLEEDGRLDDTIVVFIADHGESLGQHDWWTHGLLWGEQLRVPLVLAGPGVPEGAVLDARVRLVDLVPTLLELLDLPLEGELAGESILPLLDDPGAEDRPVYAEVHHAEGDKMGREPEMYTLTLGRWKYIHVPASGKHQLYDVEADPRELEDVIAEHPDVAAELEGLLVALGAVTGGGASLEGIDPERLEAMRALGYLGPAEGDEPSEEGDG
jgi:arylsulfatase A-like enzyme